MTDQPNYCDRVIGVPHTAADHDACERRRINALRSKSAEQDHMLTHEHTPNTEDCTVCWPVINREKFPGVEAFKAKYVGSHTTKVTDETKYTVSGNHLRITRLDSEGNPKGQPIQIDGHVQFDVPADEVREFVFDRHLNEVTMEVDMGYVDPAIIALLTGQGTPPEEMTLHRLPTRWQRFKAWLSVRLVQLTGRWLR